MFAQTLSNILIPLENAYQHPQWLQKSLHVFGENKVILPQTSYFANIHIFARQNEPELNLEFGNVLEDDEVLECVMSKQDESKKTHISRLNNILYYKNESKEDQKEFGWEETAFVGGDMEDDLFPSMLCDVLSHSISALETRFRIYSRQEIYEKFHTQLQLHTTVVTSIWKWFAMYSLQKTINETSLLFTDKGMEWLYQSCWTQLFTLFDTSYHVQQKTSCNGDHVFDSSSRVLNFEQVRTPQEPFNVLVRALLTHPHLFSLINPQKSELETKVDEFNPRTNVILNDIYHVLLSCYLWKVLQFLLGDVLTDGGKHKNPLATSLTWTEWVRNRITNTNTNKDNIKCYVERLAFFVLPFLRKCYILLYSTGLIQLDLDLLWSCLSVNSTTLPAILQKDPSVFRPELVIAECDTLCHALFLPMLHDYVATTFFAHNAKDRTKERSLHVMQCWTQTFFDKFTDEQCEYIRSVNRIDSISPISLVTLPPSFATLHIKSRKEKCFAGQIPETSVICLFCGTFLCINCCQSNRKDAPTIHSKNCGQGKGIFLYTQSLLIRLVYEHTSVDFSCPYLDSHGQQDLKLKQKDRKSLNYSKLYELWKMVADGTIPNNVCKLKNG
ncbi:hypothetical protein RFI_38442 [Reticulomyxa filosa]|uniref:E3 ubiquitin-protein ligase n=1 Tax=Reticulomyxa filosa TaxID=46433 RepID=X6LD45_RETFI|nr:hypothetical protein RFI_38442 [Reticulomyxa filosa]|eukprot:ETN99046.1 hypothetical protein RFI_38442 [Reticulomyxa filosa]